MNRVAFVEFEDELAVLERGSFERSSMLLVPMTEHVRHRAEKLGWTCQPLAALITSRTHLRTVAASERIMSEVVDAIQRHDMRSPTGSSTFIHHVRFLLHHALFLADIVVTVSARYPGATLIAVKRAFQPSGQGAVLFGTQRILWSIIGEVARARSRSVEFLQGEPRGRFASRRRSLFAALLLRGVNRLLVRCWGKTPVVLVPSLAYGMSSVALRLRAAGFCVVWARGAAHHPWRSLGAAIWTLLVAAVGVRIPRDELAAVDGVLSIPVLPVSRLQKWHRLGQIVLGQGVLYRGVELARAIEDKLLNDIVAVTAESEALEDRYEGVIEEIRPRAVLAQMARWENGAALGEAASRKDVRTILVSHGSHVRPRSRVEGVLFRDHAQGLLHSSSYQLALVQSPSAEASLRDLMPGADYVRVRPLMWGHRVVQRRVPASREPVILHAGTAKPRWAWRPWWYETVEEYIEGLNDLIGAVERLERGRLVIRYRPFPECTLEDLCASVAPSERVTIKTDGSFADDLASADVLVSFSSTTIEEALHARCPVLQYGGGGRYRHLPGLQWGERPANRSAVYSVARPSDLPSALTWILDHHHGVPLTDGELRGYVFQNGEALSFSELAAGLVSPHLLHPKIRTAKPAITAEPFLEQAHVC